MSAGITLVEAVRTALGELMAAHAEAVLLGCDIAAYGGPFRATAGLKDRFGAARVLDTPPNPSAILGFSRGLKLAGKLPICELPPELAARAAGAVVDGVGRFAARTGEAAGPMVVRIPVGRVAHGMLSDGDSPEAALGFASGLSVVCPSRPADAWSMLRSAADQRGRDAIVMLEPKALYRRLGAPLPDAPEAAALTTARRARDHRGTRADLVLIGWGASVPIALEAAERMTADGHEVGVVDLRALVPLDLETIVEAVRGAGRALVVHDAAGSFAGAVAAEVAREAFLWLEAPVGLVSSASPPQGAGGSQPGAAGPHGVGDDEDWVARVREAALATIAF